MTVLASRDDSSRTIAVPMPEDEPVTMATLPDSVLLGYDEGFGEGLAVRWPIYLRQFN
jgi:hypothetical protein